MLMYHIHICLSTVHILGECYFRLTMSWDFFYFFPEGQQGNGLVADTAAATERMITHWGGQAENWEFPGNFPGWGDRELLTPSCKLCILAA